MRDLKKFRVGAEVIDMEAHPPAKITGYRGYVAYLYDSSERVELVPPLGEGSLWQSRPRLEEALAKEVAKAIEKQRGTEVVLPKDIGGYIEEVTLELAVPPPR